MQKEKPREKRKPIFQTPSSFATKGKEDLHTCQAFLYRECVDQSETRKDLQETRVRSKSGRCILLLFTKTLPSFCYKYEFESYSLYFRFLFYSKATILGQTLPISGGVEIIENVIRGECECIKYIQNEKVAVGFV